MTKHYSECLYDIFEDNEKTRYTFRKRDDKDGFMEGVIIVPEHPIKEIHYNLGRVWQANGTRFGARIYGPEAIENHLWFKEILNEMKANRESLRILRKAFPK